ncbi:MAG: hypothetical protein ABJH07_23400 [Sedimentitalea sp.]|uniref:hypothetical protein n=1 Tax=Sedimentitalea sp. TaxID=2048915 RepID=UPI003267DEBD
MITLQELTLPETGICTEQDLYFHTRGDFSYSQSQAEIWLDQGSLLMLDTYFNLLNIGKWHEACNLDGLVAELNGAGRVELRIFIAIPGQSWETLFCEVVDLDPVEPVTADLSHYVDHATRGLIYIEVKPLGKGGATVTAGRFATRTAPVTLPRLAVSITTFKREKEVAKTAARLDDFIQSFPFGDHIHVQVVDNGNSADVAENDRVTLVENPNYGGAGGFTRGLLEAERNGFTHCLFMDDDASFQMENIARTYTFLALAKDPRTAVAGAMISNTHKWAMWENGARFDGLCRPQFGGTDLRNRDAVFEMEHRTAVERHDLFYGGWWFFAFPITQLKYHPFPFFVRGDDVSFSLKNDFKPYTLNGVVSFQDSFIEKESPQVHYLDTRSHLIHPLVTDELDRSALQSAKVAVIFISRSLMKFHYDSASAQLLAWKDVMEGPAFFDNNIDMAARRATIKDMTQTEAWHPASQHDREERRKKTLKSPARRRRLGLLTLNGHLVPFSARRWDKIVLAGEKRQLHFTFGASQVTYFNGAGDKCYTVKQSKSRFFSLGWDMVKTLWRYVREYDDLKKVYRDGYDTMATRGYWQDKLPLTPEKPDTSGESNVSRAKQISASH